MFAARFYNARFFHARFYAITGAGAVQVPRRDTTDGRLPRFIPIEPPRRPSPAEVARERRLLRQPELDRQRLREDIVRFLAEQLEAEALAAEEPAVPTLVIERDTGIQAPFVATTDPKTGQRFFKSALL